MPSKRGTYPNSVLASEMSSLFSNHNKKVTRANQIPSNKILFTLVITAFNNRPITITCFHQIKSENIRHRYHSVVFAIPLSFDGAHASVKKSPRWLQNIIQFTGQQHTACYFITHSLLSHTWWSIYSTQSMLNALKLNWRRDFILLNWVMPHGLNLFKIITCLFSLVYYSI